MPTPTCPQCGTFKVRPAPRRSVSDRVLAFLTVHPFRCQLCARRFRSLIGKRTFPVGTRLRLEFLSSHQSFPITIDGAVVRSRRDDVIGLRFVAILHAEERRIGHILNLRLPDLEPS